MDRRRLVSDGAGWFLKGYDVGRFVGREEEWAGY
jgi:hypothetical protein